jgi:uncharacterized protein YbdZ (MbtH family)
MSFRCNECGEAQEARVKPIRVVTEARQKTYSVYAEETGFGWEAVHEKDLCTACADWVEDAGAAARAQATAHVMERDRPGTVMPGPKWPSLRVPMEQPSIHTN